MHPFLSLFLKIDIVENLSIFWLILLSLLLLLVLYCFYSFHISLFFPISPFLLSSHFSFFCSPFSNVSFFFPVTPFSSWEIYGRKIVWECFLCLPGGKSLTQWSFPQRHRAGLLRCTHCTSPAFLLLLCYILFPGSLGVKVCLPLSCISPITLLLELRDMV